MSVKAQKSPDNHRNQPTVENLPGSRLRGNKGFDAFLRFVRGRYFNSLLDCPSLV